MEELSEEYSRSNCPFCESTAELDQYTLLRSKNFFVTLDTHPLTEGHLLIIPKDHVSCIGEYSYEQYKELIELYTYFSDFLEKTYGKVSSFEHGKFGQSVFHSHVQLLPYSGLPESIVNEGREYCTDLGGLEGLANKFKAEGGYLFFSINKSMWLVDSSLRVPRFFRDRFATALGHPERGNWKVMRSNPDLMSWADQVKQETMAKWMSFQEANPLKP